MTIPLDLRDWHALMTWRLGTLSNSCRQNGCLLKVDGKDLASASMRKELSEWNGPIPKPSALGRPSTRQNRRYTNDFAFPVIAVRGSMEKECHIWINTGYNWGQIAFKLPGAWVRSDPSWRPWHPPWKGAHRWRLGSFSASTFSIFKVFNPF